MQCESHSARHGGIGLATPELEKYDNMTPQERASYAHERALSWIYDHWWNVNHTVMKTNLKLEYLEIDLSNAYCPHGCCRDLGLIPFDFLKHFEVKQLRFLGLRRGEEAVMRAVVRVAFGCEDEDELAKLCEVTCNPEGDPWAKWSIAEEDVEGA
jgi:hypothetical protein